MKQFHFGVLTFIQGLSKCFHLNLPSNFFLPYVSFKPTVVYYVTYRCLLLQITFLIHLTVGLKNTQGKKKVRRQIQVKTFRQALYKCQNTKIKLIHPGNQKLPLSSSRPNCQNLTVWLACSRWQLLIPQMNFFQFDVMAFLQGLSRCCRLNLPLNFFLPYVFFKPTVNSFEFSLINFKILKFFYSTEGILNFFSKVIT